MGNQIKAIDANNVNTSTTILTSPQREGNLQGRRVINTNERINDLRKNYGDYSSSERIADIAKIGFSSLFTVLGLTDFIYRGVSEMVLGPSNEGPLRDGAGLVCFLWTAGITNLFVEHYNRRKNTVEGINDEEFIDWAEEHNFNLSRHSIDKIYRLYKEMDGNERIADVLNKYKIY